MASWLDRLADQSRFPTGSGLDSCSRGGAGDTGGVGGGLSGNGSSAGYVGVCGVRGTYGGGSSGSFTGSPWNIGFFSPSSFFLLSGWATDTLLCPCPFMQNLARGEGVCAVRSYASC